MIVMVTVLMMARPTAASPCPEGDGWFLAGASCYLVSPGQLSWDAAQEVTMVTGALNEPFFFVASPLVARLH